MADKEKELNIKDLELGEGSNSVVVQNGIVKNWRKNASKRTILLGAAAIAVLIIAIVVFFSSYNSMRKKNTINISASISIEKVRETGRLEVLTVSDSEIVIETGKDNKDAINAWTEFVGKGAFWVDLAASEFLVDNARHLVVVRTPMVMIDKDTFTIEYDKTKILFFKNQYANDSLKDGIKIAEDQLAEAYGKIYKTITTSPFYFDTAQKSAENILTNLIKSFNPDIPDLEVIVEVGVI